jgi:amino acid transporter
MIAFFNLWSNWGATLYGEVRGASDFRKNIYAMGGALVATSIAAVIMLLLFAKTFGWDFYTAANNGYGSGNGVLGAYPYPVMLGSWLVNSPVFQFILIALFSLWIFGWYGTVFLSSTRVIFATAFDRILPERAAYISPNRRVPVTALLLMAIPSIIVSALYAYWGSFARYSLDATLVIVITYMGSSFAAMIMPWRVKRLYRNSLLARWKLFGIPAITIVGFVSFGFLSYILAIYLADSVYGVNNRDSLIYMAILYAIALVIYVVAKVVRRRQGTPLENVMREIPAE